MKTDINMTNAEEYYDDIVSYICGDLNRSLATARNEGRGTVKLSVAKPFNDGIEKWLDDNNYAYYTDEAESSVSFDIFSKQIK